MSLTFNNGTLDYIDVPAPYFGEGVVIRVNKRTVKHYIRSSQLSTKLVARKDINEDDRITYHVAAGLMSVCTIPETGEFAFADEQIDDMVNKLPQELYEKLAVASFQLNPLVTETQTLSEKKSES